MAIQVALEHRTTYRFDAPMSLGPHVVRLRPAPHCRTPISAYSLTVTPEKHFLNWQQDVFGNHLARLVFPETTRELSITVDLVADLTAINPIDFFVEDYAQKFPFAYDAALLSDLEPYLRPVGAPRMSSWLASVGPPPPDGLAVIDFLANLNQWVARTIAYTVRMEQGVQSPDETLEKGIGSCRDSAWLVVAALRELGMAARFVSGYLVQLRPDPRLGQPQEGPFHDFTDLHAWAEAYVPGAGWVGLDATSGLFASEGHIPLSATPHPGHSAPVTGTTGPGTSTLEFRNTVRRLHEDPRVTLPYSDEQWERISVLGARVDEALKAGDVRLTMGGEPTFVSSSDMEGAEWRTDADGKAKRAAAQALAMRLRDHYAPKGLVHRGQGKWYPGEPLPRWQIALTWRLDGEPIWNEPGLLDDPWGPPVASADSAVTLVKAIAEELGVPTDKVIPAYEDPLHQVYEEARLPAGEPPVEDLDPTSVGRPDARAEAVARLSAPSSAPAGYVLPLFHDDATGGWATTTWTTRRGHLLLVPGTSPLGLRLPLDSLGWAPPAARPETSPFEEPESLDVPASVEDVEPAEELPRTALAVEYREGHLFVFLPPVEKLGPGLALVGAVERATKAVGTRVVLEGYNLPSEGRTTTLTVTPDPGVVEVNVHPASSWEELVEINATLSLLAAQSGLGTEKFTLDGTHTGTGGGSHLTLGGATSPESPLLRRPDLLVSLLTFWQHHPSLSYLFSGGFIGPTSQAPRVDEGRHENLYELEIAFQELARAEDPRPWEVDRALRHLLTDLTGNTHRAEFCIDKLFSPDSERGRLGLLELRGFEMPPHPQMSLVQALLVRALVARFWDEPYTGRLVRWGTELHDRFLLPGFVAADIAEVAEDLRDHGFAFETGWLDPFLEFRFPRLGQVEVAGMTVELRAAIEPWNVLGEEASANGTVRYVDSSVERLQVRVTGMTGDRYVITCNGAPVPLTSTGTATVGGVRYRAWQPWSALHPTIKVHAPLVFDVVDRWNARSVGGCTYHVVHPGGRAYDTFPVNAGEAESRRTARFEPHGHTPGTIDLGRLDRHGTSPEYPRTLDLRRSINR
ncbi:MAG: transglutaminase [Frankiales bacterium]|nr:transglutaminase [Frankiales bacterium]